MLVKRIQDFAISFTLLILLSPLFLLISILIKLTSNGPVFFLQERVGLNKRRFKIFKFRTMIPNAEKMMAELEALNELSGPVFKIKNDPRLTPLGRFLRRSSLDELPQLLNVLLGDMSLVGPRPMAVRDFEGFSEDWQRRRFSVPPGITCLWQINGRNSVPFQQWMEMDMQYIAEWSLWLDLENSGPHHPRGLERNRRRVSLPDARIQQMAMSKQSLMSLAVEDDAASNSCVHRGRGQFAACATSCCTSFTSWMNTMSIIVSCTPGIAFPKTLPATWTWPCIPATSTSFPSYFERLREKNYVCFQCLDHSINGHFFVFCWDRRIRRENRRRRPRLRSPPQRTDSRYQRGNA